MNFKRVDFVECPHCSNKLKITIKFGGYGIGPKIIEGISDGLTIDTQRKLTPDEKIK